MTKGIEHDVAADIANIRTILKGYATDQQIVKELIQNAEDANATIIHIGWHPGFPTNNELHPLLKGPALCIVNDGPFEDKHEKAICRMGLGSKGGDRQAIGRFGLGIKSIFNLCEAFFYIASDINDVNKVRYFQLFNPWKGFKHKLWDTEEEDEKTILSKIVEQFKCDIKQWFCLWLPLRRKVMLDGVAAIEENYPGDVEDPKKILKHLFVENLVQVLPMMKNLKEVNYWNWNNDAWNNYASLKTLPESKVRKFPDQFDGLSRLKGKLEVVPENGQRNSYIFAGNEKWLNDATLNELKLSEKWPKVVGITEDGEDPNEKEKGEQHISVYLSGRSLNTVGKLRIKWAVFLPVGNNYYDEIQFSSLRQDISLTLHGYFFLNSDRTNIDGLTELFKLNNNVYKEWNRELAITGTLQEVLPSLEYYVENIQLRDYEIFEITKALKDSKLFKEFGSELCRNNQWIYKLTPDKRGKWTCVQSSETLYNIPVPANNDLSLPFELFPNLREIVESRTIIFQRTLQPYPIITSTEPRQWTDSMIERLLNSITYGPIIGDDPAAEYILSFINSQPNHSEIYIRLLGDYPLFEAVSLIDRIHRRYSYNELKLFSQEHSLFLYSARDDEALTHLQSTCPELDIIELKQETSPANYVLTSIFGLSSVPNINPSSCCDTILNTLIRGAIADRVWLMQYIIDDARNSPHYESKDRQIKTVRYLLHGNYSTINNVEALYLPESNTGEAWNKLIQIMLEQREELWRLLDSNFTAHLSPEDLAVYGIKSIGWKCVSELCQTIEVNELDLSILTDNDYEQIMLSNLNDELVKSLPIHRRVGGGLVGIEENTFLNSDFTPENEYLNQWNELLSKAQVIECSINPMVSARQKNLLNELDWNAVMELALRTDEPYLYSKIIIKGVKELGTPRQDVGRLTREVKWLPLQNGQFIRPVDIIHIDRVEEEIHRILDINQHGICSILALQVWLTKHPGFNALKQLFIRPREALQKLAGILMQNPSMTLGITIMDSPDDLKEFVRVFNNSSEIMPVQPLLSAIIESNIQDPLGTCCQYLVPNLLYVADKERMIKVLNFLSEQHIRSTGENQRNYLKWFNKFLNQVMNNNSLRSILHFIKLQNMGNHWKPASELIWPSEGIAKYHQLNERQAEIMRPMMVQQEDIVGGQHGNENHTQDDLTLEESAQNIVNYFRRFEQFIPYKPIGALGALLGDFTTIINWAERMLEDEIIATIRLSMKPTNFNNDEKWIEEVSKYRFLCEIVTTEGARTSSLTGDWIEVSIENNPTSLIFGDMNELWGSVAIPNVEQYRGKKIKLLDIPNIEALTQEDINELLRNTAELIILKVHCNSITSYTPNLEALFQRLLNVGQTDILSAQLSLLNVGDFYIRQLGADQHLLIKENMKKWDRSRKYQVDSEIHTNQYERLNREAEKLRKEARGDLKNLLETNDEVRHIITQALKKKMENYQYQIDSIPFELFQNADDAYQELDIMGSNNFEVPEFIIDADNNSFKFIYWGRRINEHRSLNFENGSEHGFDRDLQKMLTLSFSDKQNMDFCTGEVLLDNVTGKFGLGFKSVFLLTDKPIVCSGRLAFEVLGGFYPKQLSIEEQNRLQKVLRHWDSTNYLKGTIIELPVRGRQDTIDDSPLLERFKSLISLLLIFSRKIKACKIKQDNNVLVDKVWKEIAIDNIPGLFYGIEQDECTKIYLIFRPQNGSKNVRGCSILFKIGTRGFGKLSEKTPSLWITTPTRESIGIGFAVNGPFDPDVGRSQIALGSEHNKRLATELGAGFGQLLILLFKKVHEQNNYFFSDLRLYRETTNYMFWDSLWEILGVDCLTAGDKSVSSSAHKILSTVTWGSCNSGYWYLIDDCPALPTRLWGDYQQLVSLQQVQFYVRGCIDINEEIYKKVSKWNSFRNRIQPGTIISGSRIYNQLNNVLSGNNYMCRPITLADVVGNEIGPNNNVTIETANEIGSLINRPFMEDLRSNRIESFKEELPNLKNLFKEYKFKSKSNYYQPAKDLVCSYYIPEHISIDEELRSGFAPPDSVISEEYSETGIKLFVVCREELNAPAEILCTWARGAKEHGQLAAVFRYLLEGELKHELSGKLGKEWFRDVLNTQEYICLSVENKVNLSWLFRLEEPSVPEPPIDTPVDSLERIYTWWMKSKDELLSEYNAMIFPEEQLPRISLQDVANIMDDHSVREQWLLLFMLGSCHTIGRCSQEQHREFLDMFTNEGWLSRLADPNATPESWLSIIDDYLATQTALPQYYNWMRGFISYYQTARWLPSYVFSLLEIANMNYPFRLDSVFNIRVNPEMTGTGLDAPPLDRALGIGACFVIRELMRSGLFDNRHAYEHAYVPSAGVCDILKRLGCFFPEGDSNISWSRDIYKFLRENLGEERADFQKSFDIPFILLSRDTQLQSDVFG